MQPLLALAVAEAAPLIAARGWVPPSESTQADADRLLNLVASYRAPKVQVESDGTVAFEWEAADHGWLTLTVNGQGQLIHGAVIDEDEFAQTEDFRDTLPDWAGTLLARLMRAGH
jgi:hypothetical protein